MISLYGLPAFNLLYAFWEIICGLYYHSFWFVTVGVYNIFLMLMRLILLFDVHGRKGKGWTTREKYRICGISLLLMNLILTGMVVTAVKESGGAHYAGYLVYAVAAYTFYRVAVAVKNVIAFHRMVLSVSNVIGFVSAMISLLSLEIAMILQFGSDGDFFRTMTIFTGTGVCLVISAVAVYMIIVSPKKAGGEK